MTFDAFGNYITSQLQTSSSIVFSTKRELAPTGYTFTPFTSSDTAHYETFMLKSASLERMVYCENGLTDDFYALHNSV